MSCSVLLPSLFCLLCLVVSWLRLLDYQKDDPEINLESRNSSQPGQDEEGLSPDHIHCNAWPELEHSSPLSIHLNAEVWDADADQHRRSNVLIHPISVQDWSISPSSDEPFRPRWWQGAQLLTWLSHALDLLLAIR